MPGTRLFWIMRKPNTYTTGAATAIAAALALSSTPLFAQQAQPAPATPPVETAPPASTLDAPPVPTADPIAVSPAPTEAPAHPAAPVRATKQAARKVSGAPVSARNVTRTTTTRVSQAAVPAAAPAPAAPAAASTTPVKPAPVVDLTTKPAPASTPAAKPANDGADPALIYGGGALALLALGGGAYALSRRRRREEDEIVHDEVYEPEAAAVVEQPVSPPRHDPVFEEQPAIVAPSAFAWGNEQPCKDPIDDGSDRCEGESWVERAYRGPSPANPSVSLKNRLRRAAFFDKRERDVAAGEARPVDPEAGLPEAAVEQELA